MVKRPGVLAVTLILLAGCGQSSSLSASPMPTPSQPGPALVQVENSVLGGSVRSARPITLLLQKSYRGVIFFSGAASKVLADIGAQQIPALPEGSDGVYFARDPRRNAPHNLYTDGDRLLKGLEQHAPRITYKLPASGSPSASPSAAPANTIDFRQTS